MASQLAPALHISEQHQQADHADMSNIIQVPIVQI